MCIVNVYMLLYAVINPATCTAIAIAYFHIALNLKTAAQNNYLSARRLVDNVAECAVIMIRRRNATTWLKVVRLYNKFVLSRDMTRGSRIEGCENLQFNLF